MKSQGRSCEGKIAHATRADALAAVRIMRRKGQRLRTGNRKHSIAAYACAFCGKWHVGHNGAPSQRYKRGKELKPPFHVHTMEP